MRRNRLQLLGLVAGAIMISFSGVWVKISHVTPTVSAFYRVFFGGIILLVMALVRREVKWQGRQNALLILLYGISALPAQTAIRTDWQVPFLCVDDRVSGYSAISGGRSVQNRGKFSDTRHAKPCGTAGIGRPQSGCGLASNC